MNSLTPANTSTMSSREIATITGKEHKNVIRVIEHAKSEQILTAQIEPLDFIHRGNTYKHYELSKKDSMYVVARLSPEFTMAIIDRWDELENNALQIPQTLPEALRMAADLAEHNTKLIEQAKEDAPKVQFVADYVEHGDSKTFTAVAAIMGVKLKLLMSALKVANVVYRRGGDWVAYSEYDKHFETKVGVNNYTNKETGLPEAKDYKQLRVTTGGLVWMQKRFGKPELNTPALKAVKV